MTRTQPLPETLDSDQPATGLTRRQVALGAAWAAPVVAIAIAAPAAAASASTASSISGATSLVSTDPSTVAPGAYPGVKVTSAFSNGYLTISNIQGTWETGALKLEISNRAGGTSSGRSILDPNGVALSSASIGESYVAGGIVWTVSNYSSTLVTLTAPSQSVTGPGSATFFAPNFTAKATYAGEWEAEDPGQWPVYAASYVVSAGNVAGGGGATGTFPANPYAPPV